MKFRISGVEYPNPAGKQYRMDGGKLTSDVEGSKQHRGKAIQYTFDDIADYAAWRKKMLERPGVMRTAGTFEESVTDGTVVGLSHEASDGMVARDNKHLAFRSGIGGIVTIDIDTIKQAPEEAAAVWTDGDVGSFLKAADVREYLISLMLELADTGMVVTPSTSAGITDVSGKLIKDSGGWHVEILVTDQSQIPAFLKALFEIEWASGERCWAFVDKGGQFQARGTVDKALARPHQPVFMAPGLGKGLKSNRVVMAFAGPPLDVGSLPKIANDVITKAKARREEAKSALKPDIARAMDSREQEEKRRQVDAGLSEAAAAEAARSVIRSQELRGEAMIFLDDGDTISAAELVMNPGKYDGRLCSDPIDPTYAGGAPKGKIYANGGYRPGIHNIHDGRFYHARHTPDTFYSCTEKMADGDIVRNFALTKCVKHIDEVSLEKAACKRLGLGNRTKEFRADIADFHEEARRRAKERTSGNRDADFDLFEDGLVEAIGIDELIPAHGFPKTVTVGNDALRVLEHTDNYDYMLRRYGISLQYDVILKEEVWTFPGVRSDTDNASNSFLGKVRDLATVSGMPSLYIKQTIMGLADANPVNPVVDYLTSLEWDGRRRIPSLVDEMGVPMERVKSSIIALQLFMIQACAAADGSERAREGARPAYEYVMVWCADQGAGKTKGMAGLIPKPLQKYYKIGAVLDVHKPDSVKETTAAWIVELSEIDATFKKSDAVAIKAFLSREVDTIRLPYAPRHSKFQRRCCYFGTVNEAQYLIDRTGNRRYLPMSINTGIVDWDADEVDQLWAEAWAEYAGGAKWWPDDDEAVLLERAAESHRTRSAIEEAIENYYAWGEEPRSDRKTATEIYNEVFESQSPRDIGDHKVREVGNAMRKFWMANGGVRDDGVIMIRLNGEMVRANAPSGQNRGWLVPPTARSMLVEKNKEKG